MKQKYVIGDLVKVMLEDKWQVVVVIGYEVAYERYVVTNDYIRETRDNISVKENEITPIPLTSKILEKNRWKTFIELHDFRYAFKIDDSCYLVVMTGFLDGIRIFIRKGTIYSKLRTLKYVSDLQHLLFGLGLKSEMEV